MEIKSNELRRGNLLLEGSEILKVGNICENGFDFVYKNGCRFVEYVDVKPIELTEELLLKCGFVKSESDPDNAWLNLKYRFLNFSSDESVGFKNVYLMLGKTEIIVEYLHQLQNLYFALTQTELQITL